MNSKGNFGTKRLSDFDGSANNKENEYATINLDIRNAAIKKSQ